MLVSELSLAEELRSLQSNGDMCDTELVSEGGHRIMVHWPLLQLRGVWWAALGRHNVTSHTVVMMPGVSRHQLTKFVRELYSADQDHTVNGLNDYPDYSDDEDTNVEQIIVKPDPDMDTKDVKTISFKVKQGKSVDDTWEDFDDEYLDSLGDECAGIARKEKLIMLINDGDTDTVTQCVLDHLHNYTPDFMSVDEEIVREMVELVELKHYQPKSVKEREYDFQCKECKATFKGFEHMYRHATTHVNKFIYCKQCDKSFKWIKTHLQNIHSGKPRIKHECNVCGRQCKTSHLLETHKQTHLHLICEFCDFECEGVTKMAKHKERKHIKKSGVMSVPCEVCGKVLLHKDHMKSHMKTHEERQQLQCEFCDQFYTDESCLKAHQRNHHLEKKFVCDICGEKFATEGKRGDHHIKFHTDLKPFECKHCDFKANCKRKLDAHKTQHRPPRHSCKFCGKTFIQKQSLNKHKMTHTGEKPYGCQEPGCGFRCIQANDLRLHYSRRHGVTKIEDITMFRDSKPNL